MVRSAGLEEVAMGGRPGPRLFGVEGLGRIFGEGLLRLRGERTRMVELGLGCDTVLGEGA
jgi:hypothetical protein